MHHHHCDHAAPHAHAPRKQTQLTLALGLVVSFALLEFSVGWFSHSLALVAEAGHLTTDSLALLLALGATWLTRLAPSSTSGGSRWELGAALINSVTLVAVAGWIAWEAIQRLQAPPIAIASTPMLLTALVGLGVNGLNIAVLHQGSDHDLNLRAAFLHVVSDALSSVGVIVAAIAIATLHWLWVDGAVSLAVSGVILTSTLPLLQRSAWQFWQSLTPARPATPNPGVEVTAGKPVAPGSPEF